MLTRKSRITKVVLWAMIPLVVFGSLPRMGCVCADGQHKTFCQRHLQGTKAGECVCCERHDVAVDAREKTDKPTAPAARHTCCQGRIGKSSSGRPELNSDRPCKPVVDQLVLLTAAKSSIDLDRIDHAPLFATVEPLPALLRCVTVESIRAESLPPPDLVTTLGVLLI
jgi:hypothetical protein